MSQEIDEKVVELVLDNYQFESRASQSISTADKLNESMQMKGVEKGFENINSAIKNSNIPNLGDAVQQVGLKFSGLWTVADQALRNITNSAMNAGKRIVSALTIDPVKMGLSEYETKINAIQTIMSNTASKGTTMSDVTKVLNDLNTYADKTIYNFAEMTKNIGTFTAAGVGLEESADAIKGIANLAAASGSTSQQASTAMYQLSQALSSGTVRLMDWNSVVNANMGGEKFQEALKQTAKESGVAIDKIIEKAGSFRESLSQGWLTADILNTTLQKFTVEGAAEYAQSMLEAGKYTEEQAEALKKEAQAMEDAATKVKTFTQLFSTLEESLQSGWAQTWEIIIGDFEEAKEQLSSFADKVGLVINKMGEFRNTVLSGGLSSGWKQLMGKGIADENSFTQMLQGVASDKGIKDLDKLEAMWEKEGGFQESLKEGWLTTDVLADSITKYTKNLEGMSMEELKAAGYTKAQVDQMIDLNDAIRKGDVSLEELVTKINRPSGAENLFQSLNNAFDALMSAIEPIKQAFMDIFFDGGDTTEKVYNLGELIYSITVKIREFTESLIIAEDSATFDKLKRTFKGLFAVVDILWELAKAFVSNIIGPLLGGVDDLGGGILGVTATFGDWLVALRDGIKESDIFNKVFKKVADIVKKVAEGVKEAWAVFKEFIAIPVIEAFSNVFERLGFRIGAVGDAAGTLKDRFVEAFNKISDYLESSGFMEFLQKAWEFIKTLAKDFGTALGNLFKNIDFDAIHDIINVVLHGGLVGVVIAFVRWLTKIGDIAKDFDSFWEGLGENIVGILGDVRGAIKTWTKQIKANVLKTIATSVLMLAGALVVLSLIDSKRLTAATLAITAMFVNIVVAMKMMSGMKFGDDSFKNIKGLTKTLYGMIAMSTAALILAGAMAIIAKLDWGGLARGLIGVTALLGAMAGTVILLNKFAKDGMGKASKGLILMATSIVILAAACKIFDTISWQGMGVGLISIVTLLGVITGYAITMSKVVKGGMKRAVGSLFIIATSLVIMAAACKIFSTMSWEEMGVGLTSVVALLGAIFAFSVGISKLTSGGKILAAAASLLIVGVALAAMAGAIKLFNFIDNGEITKAAISIAAIAGILVGLTAISKAFGGGKMIAAVGSITLFIVALVGLAGAMQMFEKVSWKSIATAVIAMGAMIGLLAAISALTSYFGVYIAAGAAVLLATGVIFALFAADLLIVAKALQEFEKVSWESIGKAAVALGAILLLFSLLGATSAFALPFATAVLMLAGAFAIFSASLSVFANGLDLLIRVVGTNIALIAEYIGAFVEAVFTGFAKGLLAFASIIVAGKEVIYQLVSAIVDVVLMVLVEKIPQVAEGFVSLIDQVLALIATYAPSIITSIAEIILAILDGLATYIPDFVEKIGVILKGLVDGIRDFICSLTSDDILSIVITMGAVFAVLTLLNLMAPFIPTAIAAVIGLATLVAEIGLILAAFGALAQIPGLTWIIEEGGNLLGTIGTALGKFVGGLVGGIAEGFTSSLPQIATDLSAFMTNLKPFIEGANLINADSMNAVKTLADVILVLTAANIMEGLTSWMTLGQSSLVGFGKELAKFGPYFRQYADSVYGIDATVVTASANAALALAEMAAKLPNSGGIVSWFTGDNRLSVFADELIAFGPKFKQYADSVSSIDPAVVTASANAASSLSELANNLPNQGGILSWITGDNKLSVFAGELAAFGPKFKKYADSVAGIDSEAVTASSNAGAALAELAKNIPSTGGLSSLWSKKDLSKFGDTLVEFGKSIKSYSNEVSGINKGAVTAASDSLTKIVDGLQKATCIDSKAVASLDTALTKLGKVGVDAFVEAFDGSVDKVNKAGKNMVTNLINGAEEKTEYMIVAFTAPIESALKAIRTKYQSFYDAGAYLVTGFANGISANDFQAAAKARAMAKAAAQAAEKALDINSPSKVFYGIGAFAGEGFVNALGDYGSKSYNAGSVMADSARRGLSSAINSIKTMIDNGIDAQPTIRPVMDLSDVQSGANAISGMLNMGSSIGVSANVGAISTMMKSYSQNGGNSEVISAINKLRDSLSNTGNTTYTINGITYDDGSNIAEAVQSIVRAARVERRT